LREGGVLNARLTSVGAIMHIQIADNAAIDAPYVSAGHLPPEQLVKALVVEAYDRLKSNIEVQNSQIYPR
jgi:hypothetical protein